MQWPQDQDAIRLQYETDGFAVVSHLFDEAEVTEIREQLSNYIQNTVPGLPRLDAFYEDKALSSDIKMLPRMHHHSAFFDQLLKVGRLPAIAKHVWKCDVNPRDAAYFNKPAKIGAATPPHQDGFYYHLEPCEAMTMWLALDEVDEENGCVRYIAGSHRKGMRPHSKTNVLGFSQGITDFGAVEQDREGVPVCVSPGDVIVHDALTIHFADPNHSPRPRRAMGFVYFSSRAQVDIVASERYSQELSAELVAKGKI